MEASRRYQKSILIQVALFIIVLAKQKQLVAQSIGYHPQFNLGFNPFLSPIFGYGLGLPFGAFNLGSAKNPLLLGSISASAPLADKHGFMGKLHANAFLKKLATNQLINLSSYPVGSQYLKDKLNLIKHPEFALTPYGVGYGYGKHYGSALVPNNPYKGAYVDYYDNSQIHKHKTTASIKTDSHLNTGDHLGTALIGSDSLQSHSVNLPANSKFYVAKYLKPILKTGAFLTSLILLGKKTLDSTPTRLNPSGMILNDFQP